jgi:Kef-type K+ transport system membrane component KefB/nucleotide-binding universal stress UspA family protein
MLAAVPPIPGHSVALLLLQLGLLLIVARVGAALSRLVGLPAVVGELAAGIVLGPSVFGHYAPRAFAVVFPQTPDQFHLLETVGVLGIVLLLLLTGLETDLKLLKNLGRAALVASVLGMLVPFVSGFGLGLWMPDDYLAQPDRRGLFASFLATAMAISAMPVIAKILMDLDLTRRNIGLVILSAGVVDDTAGWLVLSVIAGAATAGGGVQLAGLGMTVAFMVVFLIAMAVVAYPLLRFGMRIISRFHSIDGEMVVIVSFTFLCAAATERIGVHAVFGAFIAGALLRQLPDLNRDTVHRLESFVFAILAPVFFGIVGLNVNLWSLAGGGGSMLAIVLAIACFGKLAGCTLGGVWGGLSKWEAVSIAVAMNARGAMGLVVASIGLSLGILNEQMFSIIVVVAIATSFMAPIGLRLTMRMVQMTRDEADRLLAEQSRGVFNLKRLRILVPTAGGPNALFAARVANALARSSSNPVEVAYVDEKGGLVDRVFRLIGPTEAGKNLEQHLTELRQLAGDRPIRVRRLTGRIAARAITDEAAKGFDMLMVGASGRGAKIGGPVLQEIVENAPCDVVIVKAGTKQAELTKVFVPIDGSSVSRVAAEFALHYAESIGAELTLGIVSDRRAALVEEHEVRPDTLPGGPLGRSTQHTLTETWLAHSAPAVSRSDDEPRSQPLTDPPPRLSNLPTDADVETLIRISPVFRVSALRPKILGIDYDPGLGSVALAIARGGYDLVVLGAENRAVRKRLFFGHENEKILDLDSVTTAILVPGSKRPH